MWDEIYCFFGKRETTTTMTTQKILRSRRLRCAGLKILKLCYNLQNNCKIPIIFKFFAQKSLLHQSKARNALCTIISTLKFQGFQIGVWDLIFPFLRKSHLHQSPWGGRECQCQKTLGKSEWRIHAITTIGLEAFPRN